jgi:hypothetical protein
MIRIIVPVHNEESITGFINGWLHHKGTQGPHKHQANVTRLLCGFGECLWCCGVSLVYETAWRLSKTSAKLHRLSRAAELIFVDGEPVGTRVPAPHFSRLQSEALGACGVESKGQGVIKPHRSNAKLPDVLWTPSGRYDARPSGRRGRDPTLSYESMGFCPCPACWVGPPGRRKSP